MDITVLKPGLLTTIQDMGRPCYQKYGVIVSGAMDTYAARLSNIIVGNPENEAVLEITLIGPSLKLEKGTLFSLTGANLSPTIDGKSIPIGRAIYLIKDCILEFGTCINGCRSYLAVAGGFDVTIVMNSKSTYLRAGFGGFKGRALKKNDVLKIGTKSEVATTIVKKFSGDDTFVLSPWHLKSFIDINSENTVIRVFESRNFKDFKEKSIKKFFSTKFTVSSKSDRMGYKLFGEKIELKHTMEMISEPVNLGTIQIPPDGNPIILLGDRQTTGGYPKIANVTLVDIQKIAQLKPNDKITVKKITLEEATQLYFERETIIRKLKESINLMLV